MRLLLDTNVLIAAFLTRGACAELIEHCMINHDLISSEKLVKELEGSLVKKLHFSKADAAHVLRLILERTELVGPVHIDKNACRDHDDLIVLGTAVSGGCDAIITGDKDLLTLKSFRTMPILSPAEFWKWESTVLQ